MDDLSNAPETRRLIGRPVRIAGAALCGALLAVSAFAAPAQAESATVHDALGDNDTPYLDMTTLKYSNGSRNLTSTVHVDNLRKKSTYVGLTVKPTDLSGLTYSVATYGKIGEPGYVKSISRSNGTRSRVLHCGLQVHWFPIKDYVRIVVPQDCFGAHAGTVRLRAFTEVAYSEGGAGDRTTFVRLDRAAAPMRG
jgi:hypothetical protein